MEWPPEAQIGPDSGLASGPSFPAVEFGQVVAVAGRKQWFRRARYSWASRGDEGAVFDLFILRLDERAGPKILWRVRDSPGRLVSRMRVVEHARRPLLRGVRQQPPTGRNPGSRPRRPRRPAAPAAATGNEARVAERRLVTRPVRRPRRLHLDVRGSRPRARPRAADALLRSRARGDRAPRWDRREVHRRRGDGPVGRAVAHEDDAERAVRAALELVDAVHGAGSGARGSRRRC